MLSSNQDVMLRKGNREDASDIAGIWHLGWRDAHLGLVPQELADARTAASFRARATERVGETTVAVVDGAIAGFVIVVGDEVEQLYVSASHRGTGVANVLMRAAEGQIRASGHPEGWLAAVPGNARARAFYERAGWHDEGPIEYAAATNDGAINVPCHRYTKQLG